MRETNFKTSDGGSGTERTMMGRLFPSFKGLGKGLLFHPLRGLLKEVPINFRV